MNFTQFIAKAKEIEKTNTVYMWGTYGQRLTNDLIDYKAKQYPKHNTAARVARHKKLVGQGYTAWDCVGLIKGILWGWDKDKGVSYIGNKEVPDVGSDSMYRNYTTHQSTSFQGILPGEAVWIPGHIGIYIGDGLVIEATSKSGGGFTDNVMISALGNIGTVKGYPTRSWTHHGRLRWIDYQAPPEPEPGEHIIHTVVKGDTPWGLAVKYLRNGTRYPEIMEWNGLAVNSNIYVGQKLIIYTKGEPPYIPPAPEPDYLEYTVVKGDTPWGLAVQYLGKGTRYPEIMRASGLKDDDNIYVGQKLIIPIECPIAEPEAFKPYKARVNTKNGLNVRKSPSTSSSVVKVLGNGTIITVEKEQDGWGQIPAHKGWVSLAFTVKQ